VHLWADRFEGALEDIFDLQDQVTASVVGAIAPKLEQAEIERAMRKPTDNLDAYDCFLRGMVGAHQSTREGIAEALAHFRRAIELDPDFAAAHGMAARCYAQRQACGWVTDRQKDIEETSRLARRAVELGRNDAVALATAGFALADVVNDLHDGDALIEQALTLNPNLAWAWLWSGWTKISLGQPDDGIERVMHAMRLSPHDPLAFSMQCAIGSAHFVAGRYAEALSWAEMAVRGKPDWLLASCLAAASAALAGRSAETQKAMTCLRGIDPAFRIPNLRDVIPYLRSEDFARWAEGLRRAGLPE
jgi:tetratricopeptide (TPR) repeat protein